MTTAPQDGIIVVALEQALAAPLATRQLADLGATVLKVERPKDGDFDRHRATPRWRAGPGFHLDQPGQTEHRARPEERRRPGPFANVDESQADLDRLAP